MKQTDIMKIALMDMIAQEIRDQKLTQVQAGALLGVDRARVSNILNHKIDFFSIDALIRFYEQLGKKASLSVEAW